MSATTQNSEITNYSEEEISVWAEECFLEEEKYITRIYVALLGLIATNPLFENFIPSTALRITELAFCAVMAHSLFTLYRLKALVFFQGWSKFLCTLLALCLIQILIRGNWLELTGKELPLYFLSNIFCLPYLLPFCLLFLPNKDHIERISNIFFWGTLLVIPIWIINANNLIGKTFEGESIGAYLPFLGCFLIAYPTNLPKGRKLILWSIWGIYLLLMLLNARRNMIFSLCFYGFIGYYVNLSKFIGSRTMRIIISTIIGTLVAAPLFLSFSSIMGNYFSRLENRMDEDTRSGVELLFWADYANSTQIQHAFGKGSHGSYYQEMIDKDTGEITTDRVLIETGYLNMLLKGGYIFMAVLIVLMITCFIKSFEIKPTEGTFCKLIFILFAVDCYATDLVCMFTTQSVIFWISVNLALDYWEQNEYSNFEEDEDIKKLPISTF